MPAAARRFGRDKSGVIVALEAGKIEIVSKLSTWRKVGVVAKVASQQAGRSRTLNAFMGATRATARSFGHVLHQLWLEMVGVLFLVMALSLTSASFKEYNKYHAGHAGVGRFVTTLAFAVTFAWFGVTSFWRVHKKKQGS